MKTHPLETYGPYLLLAGMIITAAVFRPALPIDETRYLTVAWEMFLNKQYAVLSLNFEPYHHKPPMLFWLINLSWNIFGVSRAAALVPVFLASALFIFLTHKLSERLFTDKTSIVPWVMAGSIPFMLYSTLLMFDILIGVFVLAVLIAMLDYARQGKTHLLCAAGILTGLAVLTKGPVAYLYILWPLILYKVWRREDDLPPRRFYIALACMIVLSLIPVIIWLVPVVLHSNNNFVYWLLWEQTAGRVTGNFSAAHTRPFYFYLMLAPLLVMPWILFPRTWQRLRSVTFQDKGIVFLACWVLPVFASFSVISGKQPHYLVPLLPAAVLFMSYLLDGAAKRHIVTLTLSLFAVFVAGHIAADRLYFDGFRASGIVAFIQAHPDSEYAFSRNYQGELGFAARLGKPITNLTRNDLPAWFAAHPDGYAIVRYKEGEDISPYREVYSEQYRGKRLGIFEHRN